MQSVLPLIFPETGNRFIQVKAALLSDAEQQTLVKLAIDVLELRHHPGECLNSPNHLKEYLRLKLGDSKNEIFGAVFLDNKHRIICDEVIFTGSITSASVYPRVLAQKALEHNAAALFLYHNHPSGDPEPSSADEHITNKVKDALHLIEVRVLDHLVVGSEGAISFADRGLI